MMGTGESSGDNRAIEAAEKAISNPLLDGVSMKGAKGVIVSITGGEDMRLMEVDEAANHIRELVDPDANIIWGSAFNNDLEGKIRVSVVATGIEANPETAAEPAKVFSFPNTSRPRVEAPAPAPAPAPQAAAPVAAPEPIAPVTQAAPAVKAEADELLLGSETIFTPPVASTPLPPQAEPVQADPAGQQRRWIGAGTPDDAPQPAARTVRSSTPSGPAPRSEGGTLFERMSSIARGASKAPAGDEGDAGQQRRDSLDLPGFLGRQNNQ
jgi:cell division protein FtsZ